jgi:lipoprotein-releasing system ATP-binding protein
MIVLKAVQVKKRFAAPAPVDVLKGVDLELASGESIAIMGKSGEGKSTLLHVLGTLERPTSGSLFILGRDVSSGDLSTLRNRHIGFIFQNFHLLEEESALQNVLIPAKIARVPIHPGSAAHTRALMLLERVGLKERIHFCAKLLSGGEKQRTSIARALMNDPELILADEPSGNLDHAQSQEVHRLLIDCAKTFGKSLIVVTHDKELSALCDKTYLLKDGLL